jgi:hypothetical protein
MSSSARTCRPSPPELDRSRISFHLDLLNELLQLVDRNISRLEQGEQIDVEAVLQRSADLLEEAEKSIRALTRLK